MRRLGLPALTVLFIAFAHPAAAQRDAQVASTKHNLSVSGSGDVTATSENRICVFCHTPHLSNNSPGTPLWNKQKSSATYTTYTSASLDAETISGQLQDPGGSSKMCLSCHDGTMAIGTVNMLGGEQNVTIALTGTGAGGTMPLGSGIQTGFTRNLDIDLRNDHPISLTYDTTLANTDGELFNPATAAHIGTRSPGNKYPIPLEPTGPVGEAQVQCGSCHDPHIYDAGAGATVKFLRLQRFQQSPAAQGLFDESSDIVCIGCHDKEDWVLSAHADSTVADETYTGSAASLREFPTGLAVWRAACLNCHDPHTVHGARRLVREGTDSVSTPKNGGNSAIEETCYQCHSSISILSPATGDVPDIQSDFQLSRRMPITSTDQPAGQEMHEILNANLEESQVLLGKTNLNNRHAECTDCHNPHRVLRNRVFNGSGDSSYGTHDHSAPHSNIASGVLSGSWGVEPLYSTNSFLVRPSGYLILEGAAGSSGSTDINSDHVTREYQVCFKCHSDFGYDDNELYPNGSRPNLGDSLGGTDPGTNDLYQYTNQAMEFQAHFTDQGVPGTHINHRSWHPVMDITDRTASDRRMSANAFLSPWNGAVGSQTMYCSDCHGSTTGVTTVVPDGGDSGSPWGPHGSNEDFLLKGTWDDRTGNPSRSAPATDPDNGICFKCHDHRTYADRNGNGRNSGFREADGENNLHAVHADRIEEMRCTWCHIAVPHGWKNKGLLVDLNNVGAEAGRNPGTEINITSNAMSYTQGPYYLNAKLKVVTWRRSGRWRQQDCGSTSDQNGIGDDWMDSVCSNPP